MYKVMRTFFDKKKRTEHFGIKEITGQRISHSVMRKRKYLIEHSKSSSEAEETRFALLSKPCALLTS